MKTRFVLLAVPVLLLAACASPNETGGDPGEGRIQVVASTNVYGDVAATIGGDRVEVSSIISSPAQDPHSYEASAQDQLAISKADLVIENGGGYDSFIETLLDGSGSDAVVVTATALGDHEHQEGEEQAEGEEHAEEPTEGEHADEGEPHGDHEHGAHEHDHSVNEHVWYDLHVMGELAHELSHALGELDPQSEEYFHSNYEEFQAGIEELEESVAHLGFDGEGVLVTEPVPLFLLEDAGLVNLTPAEFTEAIEEGADVPPSALLDTLGLVDAGGITLLAYNGQTASTETERVRDAAEQAGIPVVEFTETLPDGADYLSWMSDNIEQIEAATQQ